MDEVLTYQDFINKYNMQFIQPNFEYLEYLKTLDIFNQTYKNYQEYLKNFSSLLNVIDIKDPLEFYIAYSEFMLPENYLQVKVKPNFYIKRGKYDEIPEILGSHVFLNSAVCRHKCHFYIDVMEELNILAYAIICDDKTKNNNLDHMIIGLDYEGIKMFLDPVFQLIGYYTSFDKINLVNQKGSYGKKEMSFSKNIDYWKLHNQNNFQEFLGQVNCDNRNLNISDMRYEVLNKIKRNLKILKSFSKDTKEIRKDIVLNQAVIAGYPCLKKKRF